MKNLKKLLHFKSVSTPSEVEESIPKGFIEHVESGKVLDGSHSRVVLAESEENNDFQLWYLTTGGLICNVGRPTHVVEFSGHDILMKPRFDGNERQLWNFAHSNGIIISQKKMKYCVEPAKDGVNLELVKKKKKQKNARQKFFIIPLEEYEFEAALNMREKKKKMKKIKSQSQAPQQQPQPVVKAQGIGQQQGMQGNPVDGLLRTLDKEEVQQKQSTKIIPQPYPNQQMMMPQPPQQQQVQQQPVPQQQQMYIPGMIFQPVQMMQGNNMNMNMNMNMMQSSGPPLPMMPVPKSAQSGNQQDQPQGGSNLDLDDLDVTLSKRYEI